MWNLSGVGQRINLGTDGASAIAEEDWNVGAMKVGQAFIVAVTGAQGVGKSTFCRKLHAELMAKENATVCLLDGLGQSVRDLGIAVGSSASPESIAAIYTAHIKRQRETCVQTVILDRCAIDALAYVRCLGLTSPTTTKLYEEISLFLMQTIDVVIHLEMTGLFETRTATHETDNLRACVSRNIDGIIEASNLTVLRMNAADVDAIDRAMSFIRLNNRINVQ